MNLIVGLGQTGLSCVKFFLREQIPFAVIDSREHPPGEAEFLKCAPHAPFSFGQWSEALLEKADQLVISPGVSIQEPFIARAIAKGMPYVGDIELFVKRVHAPIVAVTGANGKSTVTTLVGEMAREAGLRVWVAGNIGVPVLDLLTEREPDLIVLELSSFQLETTFSLKASAATILNVTEDHMDRYANFESYIAAKQRIYQNARVAVMNRVDQHTWPRAEMNCLRFGLSAPEKENDYGLLTKNHDVFLARGDTSLLNVNALKLRGRHNLENVLASLALGEAVNLPMPAMLQAVEKFLGLPHRCQFVREKNGVQFYNDSKATNVGAAIASIEGLGNPNRQNIILIAGGLGKGADFSLLRDAVSRYVKHLILIGKDASIIAQATSGAVEMTLASTFEEAIRLAEKQAVSDDIVLLAPACASFDMFKNYEHRGEEFVKRVMAL